MTERYLESRSAIVTGGATGQGHAIALALATRGCDVAIGSRLSGDDREVAGVFTHLPSREHMDSVCDELKTHGVRALGMDLDVRSNDSCESLYNHALESFGRVDILVNAAGIYFLHPVCGHDDEDWHRVIDINLNGAYRMTKLALGSMIDAGWGRIVNIASTASNVGASENAAYCASKAGLLGLTRCVALEGAPHGVTCNAINPGYVNTAMMGQSIEHEAALTGESVEQRTKAITATYPQKRALEPKEIAALVTFLCHDDAMGITMEDIDVAGGALW